MQVPTSGHRRVFVYNVVRPLCDLEDYVGDLMLCVSCNGKHVIIHPRLPRIGQNHHFYGKHHSPETRQKISHALKGKKKSPEACKHMSENHAGVSGKNHPNYRGYNTNHNALHQG